MRMYVYTHINIIYIIYIHTQSLCGSILMVLFLFWFDLVLFFEGRSHIVLNAWSVCLHLESAGIKVCLLLPLTQCWGWGPGPRHSRSALHTLSHILSLVLRILKLCFTHGHTLMNVLTLSEMPRQLVFSMCVPLYSFPLRGSDALYPWFTDIQDALNSLGRLWLVDRVSRTYSI